MLTSLIMVDEEVCFLSIMLINLMILFIVIYFFLLISLLNAIIITHAMLISSSVMTITRCHRIVPKKKYVDR
ncbi:unnamed protein product [Musa acuminata subsp. malaccensis]|uniref:(wild Malaysian banana) hypothetical protein n=1 Tax=Musa acuminata subsp. malaccensis TaxID=214687 RepID=A0A804I9U8_MUSAM|nr:unnamed protein product [Musa acuminata subsp. malaccensis]